VARYAAPRYIDNHIAPYDAMPPGHRFGLFFKSWKQDWNPDDTGKKEGLKETLVLDKATLELLQALRLRQASQAQSLSNPPLQISAISESPFMTGTGMEHPLENGFAFLNPYGLPYLSGSGVKGVLRSAAEELALDMATEDGWNLLAVWWLFGFDTSSVHLTGKAIAPLKAEAEQLQASYRQQIPNLAANPWLVPFISAVLSGRERADYLAHPAKFLEDIGSKRTLRESIHLRGSLCFWDVIPEPGGNQLGMDILTPHHRDYYQGKSAPNDCGQPIPNQFLVIPAGSRFLFNVQCNTTGLPEALTESWRKLLETAFEHAFDWFGFGAKTAVGYGQLLRNDDEIEDMRQKNMLLQKHEQQQAAEAAQLAAEEERRASLSPFEKSLLEVTEADPDPKKSEGAKLLTALKQGKWQGEEAKLVAEKVKSELVQQKKWKEKTEKKNPAKDHDYQKTLEVLKYLGGSL